MLKVVICDDHKESILQLEKHLRETIRFEYTVISFDSEKNFLEALSSGEVFDIVLLDIVFKDDLGTNIAKVVNDCLPGASIIFISYTTDYTQEMYETKHIYFLKKPISAEKFKIAIDKAIEKLKNKCWIIRNKGQLHRIFVDDILLLESCAKKTKIYLLNDVIEHYIKLDEIEKQLFIPCFARCHKSYIVNFNHVVKIDKLSVFLKDDTIVPISRGFSKEFKNKVADFFLKEGVIYV